VSGVSAVMLNVTAAYPERSGRLNVYPAGATVPNTATVQFRAGAAVPNFALAKVGRDGRVRIANDSRGSTPVVVDVAGYVLDGFPTTRGAYVALSPTRVADTRVPFGLPGRMGPDDDAGIDDLYRTKVPVRPGPILAYALTVSTADSTAPSYLAISPKVNHTTSTVQHRPGSNTSGTGFGRGVTVYNRSGSVDVVIDTNGYFLGDDLPTAGTGVVEGRVTDQAGKGLPLAQVFVYDSASWGGGDPQGVHLPTDSDGRYALSVPAREYKVCVDWFAAPGRDYADECYDDKPWGTCGSGCNPPQDAAVLTVTPGSTTRADFALARR
jgi:hypothetical protein